MNICLFSPYVPNHFGGGEKYFFDVAQVLRKKHEVSVAISGIHGNISPQTIASVRRSYEKFLGYSLGNIQFISTPLGSSSFFLNKLFWTKKFDVLYYQTDGSLFFSLAKKNILHIQVPLLLNKGSLLERLKLLHWGVKNTNSFFTKRIIEKSWNTHIDFVHHPMISTDMFLPNRNSKQKLSDELQQKEKIILHVGRFFRHQHSKKQEVLIDIYKKMIKRHPKETKEWRMVLIGGIEDKKYASKLRKATLGWPIEIHHDVKREKLLEWYRLASIYWHATGYGISEEKHPEKMEHFGISTVEAMASGCVPVVIGKGGQPEILGEELKKWLWEKKEECEEKTLELINDSALRISEQEKSIKRATLFSEKIFSRTLFKMVDTK